MENQALGLAERLGLPVEVKRVKLARPWRWLAPRMPFSPFGHTLPGSSPLAPPWPGIVIGCGRQSIPIVRAIKEASGGRTLLVQTQNPRIAASHFDLVIPPEHDGLTGANVFPIVGSPNRITPAKLSGARAAFANLLMPVKAPRLTVLIGGPNKAYQFGEGEAAAIGEALRALSRDFGLIVLPSRRTGTENVARLVSALENTGAFLWNGDGENPYLGALGWSDAFLVTADSVNMACEAAATGKPVHIYQLPGGSEKFRKFHASLAGRGIARPFTGEIAQWRYEPLDETGRAAKRVRELLDVSATAPDMKARGVDG
ncbi:MAG: mitochondrial fission ELM1 family protein [Rhizomicrobium sp.]